MFLVTLISLFAFDQCFASVLEFKTPFSFAERHLVCVCALGILRYCGGKIGLVSECEFKWRVTSGVVYHRVICKTYKVKLIVPFLI